MKNKRIHFLRVLLCGMLIFTFIAGSISTRAIAKKIQYTSQELEKIIDAGLDFKQKQAAASSVQKLIDTELTKNAGKGSMEWLVIALSQYKEDYDYSNYNKALEKYVNANQSLKATDLQRIALACSAAGGEEEFIQATINGSIGELGVMSYIYGLILMDSRDYQSDKYSRDEIIDETLSLRMKDGGWALGGKTADVDITAMAIQALAPYYGQMAVKDAVDNALALLSKLQLKTGDFKSWGTRSCESGAQVITALCALNIDCQTDKRFIKNNKTLLDGLMLYKNPDGSFSHVIDGKSDNTASVQAMYSLVAYWRLQNGEGSFYKFAKSDSAGKEINSGVTDVGSDTDKAVDSSNNISNVKNTREEKDSTFSYKVIVPLAGIVLVIIIAGAYSLIRKKVRRAV